MKNQILICLMLIAGVMGTSSAQDVAASLDEAKSSYSSGDLENARFALQQALTGINQAIGNDILAMMPETLGKMNKVEDSDAVTGTSAGFAGLYVSREYMQDSTSSASFQIMSDSPMLGAISSMLSMSVFFAADPNQKRIKVEGYKALLTRNEDDFGKVTFEMQLPFGNSLLTLGTTGISDEKDFTAVLGEIPVAEIVKKAE